MTKLEELEAAADKLHQIVKEISTLGLTEQCLMAGFTLGIAVKLKRDAIEIIDSIRIERGRE
jgi:hypothetical protein